MSHGSGREKAALWRDRFRRYSHSGLTVARYCSEEGVSVPSFYAWCKKLANDEPSGQGAAQAQVFQPVLVAAARSALSIRLPSGVEMEVPAENLEMIRVVIGELTRADQGAAAGGVPC